MKLPIQDKKFRWLLLCVALAVTLEVLSLVDIELPMPYAPFAYAVLILGIGYEVLLNGMKALFKLKFSRRLNDFSIDIYASFGRLCTPLKE